MTILERNDIQRILLYGLSWRPASSVALLAIEDGARAAGWLARQLEQGNIPSAELDPERAPEPDTGADHQLFVAFTHDGLRQLGLGPEALETFLPEFRQGMTAAHRARVIGDTNGAEWAWGNASRPVHLWCAAYARKPQFLPRFRSMPPEGCRVVEQLDCVLEPREPFGFRDGLSQPYVQGSGRSDRAFPERDCVPAGEFILGYPNAFGVLPASPHLLAERAPATPAAPAPLDLPLLPLSRAYDLGKNGSYLVARQLVQQVRDFRALDPVLQACLVGRWPDGKSLATHPPDSAPAAVAGLDPTGNDFGYFAEDAAGLRCPLGSHVRRVNPRDALADAELGISPEEALRRANQHRLLRRSRRYVQGMETGLLFLCFNANIERQFEFVQQAWINSPSFAGPRHEIDPLSSAAPGEFTLRPGPDREVVRPLSGRAGLQSFVSVRGGAYLFMPGLRALRYLISLSSGAARRGSSRAPARASGSREPPPH